MLGKLSICYCVIYFFAIYRRSCLGGVKYRLERAARYLVFRSRYYFLWEPRCIADLAFGDYKRNFSPRLSQSPFFFVRSCSFGTKESSANCGFMSVDHDGHLSLQFALYQPSDFSPFSSRQTAAAAFPLQFLYFESMNPFLLPGANPPVRLRVVFHVVGLLPSGISRFSATANSTAFLSDGDRILTWSRNECRNEMRLFPHQAFISRIVLSRSIIDGNQVIEKEFKRNFPAECPLSGNLVKGVFFLERSRWQANTRGKARVMNGWFNIYRRTCSFQQLQHHRETCSTDAIVILNYARYPACT